MAKLPDLVSGFKMLKEVDLNAVRKQAEAPLKVMVIGEAGSGKTALIAQLLEGPRSDEFPGSSAVTMHRPDAVSEIPDDTLALVLLDARKTEHQKEKIVFEKLLAKKTPTVICFNKADLASEEILQLERSAWPGVEIAIIAATDRDTLLRELAPAIMRACKGREAQLGRHIPLLRTPVIRKLVEDTCFINATYSLTSGLAEMVPVLNLPLNLADILVLTKNQAMMAYTITLAMGMKGDWKDTMPKLAAVVGSAFLWRQLARYLAGLIPVIGIVPKVVISYSGTYVIGEAIYQWCANGEKLNPEQLKNLYAEAIEKGSEVAKMLIEKGDTTQHQAADKFKEIAQNISEQAVITQKEATNRFQAAVAFLDDKTHGARQQIFSFAGRVFKPATVCPHCGKKAVREAEFCAFCGKPLNG